MSSVRDADSESASCLDVLYGLVGFCQVKSNMTSLLHSSPGCVHNVYAAVFVISCYHQYRHRKDAFCDVQFRSHAEYLFSSTGLTGCLVPNRIVITQEDYSSTDIYERYYPRRKYMIKQYIENANFEDTGFSYTLSLISGKHKMVILYCLMEYETVRFNELKRYLKNISDKTLSSNLKQLEADHLIIRKEYPQIPPKVEYSLSERGRSLMDVLDQLCVWGEENRE